MALYPPIVASSMPAFAITGKNSKNYARIYFTLSAYNSLQIDDIKTIHITVRDQASNNNKLKSSSGILVKEFDKSQTDEDRVLNRYHIDIFSSELAEGFKVDKIYKVQLRLSTILPSTPITGDFLINNINKFSEWSTVCIIKPISSPTFYINEFYTFKDENNSSNINIIGNSSNAYTFTYPFADFSGVYNPNGSSLTLKAWRLRLLNSSYTSSKYALIDNYTEADSGWQASSAYNYTLDYTALSLKCSLPYLFTNLTTYKLLFEIKTRNDFTSSVMYTFKYMLIAADGLSGRLYTYVNLELGYIKISHSILLSGGTALQGNVVLRRSDSRGNFLNWLDLKIWTLTGSLTNSLTYYDFTALSGMAYRYMLQAIDVRGRRGVPLLDRCAIAGTATIADWENAYLLLTTGNGSIDGTKQLKLKYDFQISSLKTNLFENKIDTIGSKYPFIRKNGNTYYRSFACSGTIVSCTDNVDLFTSKLLLYDNVANIYENSEFHDYKALLLKPNNYNYIYERKFREKVELFLYNSKVKLYKSVQLGNIFVKLMEVSLTPKNLLGRLIYEFSATAYEIDDYSIENLIKYNFINVGTYSTQLTYDIEKFGQLTSYDMAGNPNGIIFKGGINIIKGSVISIAKKLNLGVVIDGVKLKDFKIKYLRLTIESLPYLIILDSNGILRPYDDIEDGTTPSNWLKENYLKPIREKLYQIKSTYTNNNADVNIYLGTLFYLNSNKTKSIVISHPNNIYELKDDNLLLPSSTYISPAKSTFMSVDYVIKGSVLIDTSNVPKNRLVQTKVGQIMGTYDNTQLLINLIKYKYTGTYTMGDNAKIKLYSTGVYSIAIDTLPNTVVYIKTDAFNNLDQPERFVVNETGLLNFDFNSNNDVNVTSFRIRGINIKENKINDKGYIDNINNVTLAKTYDLYKTVNLLDEELYYIYYKNKFHEADKHQKLNDSFISYDIKCPVDALIFYTTQVRSDYY